MKMSSINKVYIKHVSIHTLRLLHVVGKMATSDFLFNSSALSLFHSPTLTSIYDYWKNHSFD